MGVLIVGLVIFLGVHSIRLVGLRDVTARAMGEGMFAVVYSLLSAIGLALIVLCLHKNFLLARLGLWASALTYTCLVGYHLLLFRI